MIIAIDYDDTYTRDPITFNKLIGLFKSAGHTVICVTLRDNSELMANPVLDSIGKLVPVIFAAGAWKTEIALKHGYKVDVWIDDMPQLICPPPLVIK